MMKLLDDFNRASGNKPEARWGWMDWFVTGALVVGLVLVLSCGSTSQVAAPPAAVPDPAVWCEGYAEWGDAWCACMWEADSTYFAEAER